MAGCAGFGLDRNGEINANTKDRKDNQGGVWVLPPNFGAGGDNRAKYAAIGESDRRSVRFMKP